jgi:hypothetical protein
MYVRRGKAQKEPTRFYYDFLQYCMGAKSIEDLGPERSKRTESRRDLRYRINNKYRSGMSTRGSLNALSQILHTSCSILEFFRCSTTASCGPGKSFAGNLPWY